MRVALVNTNRIRPPIAPIGLEYVAEALNAAGHRVEVLDLCWADDPVSAIRAFFEAGGFGLVGLTLRNTDDCAYTSRQSFLREFTEYVDAIRACTDTPIVIGGVGFSVMPEAILGLCKADAGIWGDGEFALVEMAHRMESKREWDGVPGLIYQGKGGIVSNPPLMQPLADLPPMGRQWVENRRYFLEGGQAGFETKRGCAGRCIYCADPIAKGRTTRLRPPHAVADEIEQLIAQGIDHLHTCDSEFNMPEGHAASVCTEIVRRGLGGRIRWYAYCSPLPFSAELAALMRDAGCAGINFGVDSGNEGMLRSLGRDFTPDDILQAVSLCKDAGIAVMLDLLIGAPGETRESIINTIDIVRKTGADRIGIAAGVRVYPETELQRLLDKKDGRDGYTGGDSLLDPLFFIEPAVAPFLFELLDTTIGDDRRFLFFDPSRPDRNYNYNANEVLVAAIRKGLRGAYWDILRRCEEA